MRVNRIARALRESVLTLIIKRAGVTLLEEINEVRKSLENNSALIRKILNRYDDQIKSIKGPDQDKKPETMPERSSI